MSSATTERVAAPSYHATITFTPAQGAASCQVMVDLDRAAAVGSLISVVPRSAVCEAPLVVVSVGDPAASFAMAALFAITGVASFKAWSGLGRDTPTARSARTMRLAL